MSTQWVKFQHGFDADRSAGRFQVRTYNTISTAYGRRGDFGARMFSEGNALQSAAFTGMAHPVVGQAFIWTTNVSGYRMCTIMEGSTRHIYLTRENDGSVNIYNYNGGSPTAIATSSPGVTTTNVAHFIVIDCVLGNTGSVDVWIDGARVIHATSVDTQNGGSGLCDSVVWGHDTGFSATLEFRVMDIYVADGADANYHIMHDVRFQKQKVNSDDSVAFTPSTGTAHYACLNDVPFDAADYCSDAVSGDIERLGVETGTFTYPIISVSVIGSMAKDSGSASARLGVRYSGTSLNGSDNILSTTAQVFGEIWNEKPGGGAWNTTARDAMKPFCENRT